MAESSGFFEREMVQETAAANLGVLLARAIVPLYFLLGAALKIVSGSPTHLPPALIQWTGAIGLDLLYVFRVSIAGELVVVGVMLFIPRLSRFAGLLLLGLFIPVLVGDLVMGSASCGCFGAVKVSPWITLVIDSALLVGLWWFGRRAESLRMTRMVPTWQVVVAGLWTILSFFVGFSVGGGLLASEGVADSAGATPLPAEGFYMPVFEEWIGRPWAEIEMGAWFVGEEEPVGSGTEYLIFYRKDCEHCHELMQAWFSGELPAPTLAVAVPERNGFPETGVQPFACPACRKTELPSGVDWFLQTPVLVRLEDGKVACAAETGAAEPVCLQF